MDRSIPERDWKYLRSIREQMLSELCARINREAMERLQSPAESEHKRYLRLHRHVEESDRAVGDCFNDWRRSNIIVNVVYLRRQGLLTEERLARLSDETRD